MPVSFNDLPRDRNGIVQGAWRLIHRNPEFNGVIGPYAFRGGRSIAAAWGFSLARVVNLAGADLDIEPWDEALPGGLPIPLNVPPEVLEAFRRKSSPRFDQVQGTLEVHLETQEAAQPRESGQPALARKPMRR